MNLKIFSSVLALCYSSVFAQTDSITTFGFSTQVGKLQFLNQHLLKTSYTPKMSYGIGMHSHIETGFIVGIMYQATSFEVRNQKYIGLSQEARFRQALIHLGYEITLKNHFYITPTLGIGTTRVINNYENNYKKSYSSRGGFFFINPVLKYNLNSNFALILNNQFSLHILEIKVNTADQNFYRNNPSWLISLGLEFNFPI